MKISPKYPVISAPRLRGNFVDHVHCTYNNLLPKVTNNGAFILKAKAKKSHITSNTKSHTSQAIAKKSHTHGQYHKSYTF